ncbi:MAG: pilus assembly PilX N-terminal domain-containing protein [bacterium]
MNIKNKKINKLLLKKVSSNKGIALLFTIMLSTIFLTMALGVTNIASKELAFSSSAKDSNNAFYAAESGIECALYNDKSTSTFFTATNPADPADFLCFGNSVNLNSNINEFDFIISGLGSNNNSCAKVKIVKTFDNSVTPPAVVSTKITSNGYNLEGNNCDYTGPNLVERVLEVTY